MKLSAISFAICMIIAASASASTKTVTVCADGVLVETEAAAIKGIAEIPLPSGMMEGSLRIRPLGDAAIQQVDIVPMKQEPRREKELNGLMEQKSKLEDRLHALSVREAIFKKAAQSQSGKTPRRSKANPDPMQSLRQGTDFAISQLESVYTSRRKTEKDIAGVEKKIAELKRAATPSSIARVTLSRKSGRIAAVYATSDAGWTPRYNIRLDGASNAKVTLIAHAVSPFAGAQLKICRPPLSECSTARAIAASASSDAKLEEYLMKASSENFASGVTPEFSFSLENSSSAYLPPGEASVFRKGEYIGIARFEGISSGRSRTISRGGK